MVMKSDKSTCTSWNRNYSWVVFKWRARFLYLHLVKIRSNFIQYWFFKKSIFFVISNHLKQIKNKIIISNKTSDSETFGAVFAMSIRLILQLKSRSYMGCMRCTRMEVHRLMMSKAANRPGHNMVMRMENRLNRHLDRRGSNMNMGLALPTQQRTRKEQQQSKQREEKWAHFRSNTFSATEITKTRKSSTQIHCYSN